ncbi:hypothetical protein [Oceanicella sp. SM1341]|uniref:hypothetical protein n=1 Tax=Oceanicella sp. SM1341 TaxID=1548889 RepID=UPI000E545713|nr:hypothetical protein [Oceanicella sp. SM1341]
MPEAERRRRRRRHGRKRGQDAPPAGLRARAFHLLQGALLLLLALCLADISADSPALNPAKRVAGPDGDWRLSALEDLYDPSAYLFQKGYGFLLAGTEEEVFGAPESAPEEAARQEAAQEEELFAALTGMVPGRVRAPDPAPGAAPALTPEQQRARILAELRAEIEAEEDDPLAQHADRAVRHLRASLAHAPGNIYAWDALGNAELLRGDARAAWQALRRSWELAPYSRPVAFERLRLASRLSLFPQPPGPADLDAMTRDIAVSLHFDRWYYRAWVQPDLAPLLQGLDTLYRADPMDPDAPALPEASPDVPSG